MAENRQKYTIQFEANAKGLDEIVKKIEQITKTSELKLTPGMEKDFQKLQASLKTFMTALSAELSKENPAEETLKSLHSTFIKLNDAAQKFGLNLTSLSIPKNLQDDLTEATKKLVEQQKAVKNLQAQYRTASSKVGENDAPTVKTQGMAFGKAGGAKLEAGPGGAMYADVGEVQARIEALKEWNATLDASNDQYKKNVTELDSLNSFMAQYEIECKKIITAAKQKMSETEQEITQRKTTIAQIKEEINGIKDKATNSEEEQQVINTIIDLLNQLNAVRSNQIDALQNEKAAQQAAKQAAQEAAAARKKELDAQNAKNKAYEKSVTTLDSATKAQDKQSIALDKNTSLLTKATKQVITYGTVVSLLKRVYSETIKTITDMDEALTGMAVVTSMSREETWNLVGSFQELANATGKTTTEIADMATKFYQQGKSTSQVLELTEAAAKAATIAGIDGSRSIDLLTNAMNGFQMSSSKAMEVSDKFAALAASAATDYEELATALSKVAAQANLAGMSMDFTLGMLTKGIEVTREAPETIGTALKTVIARMRELSDYGSTLEDGMDVNRVEKALSNVGVALRDENGEFRDLEVVLTELGKKWDGLNKNQQANVAVALAGTRQQSRLIAMMQDFDRTLELVDTSANSYGATMAQSAKYMQGLEANLTLLTNAWQKLITDLTSSDVIIGVVDILTQVVEAVDGLVSNSGVLIGILITAAVLGSGALANKIQEWSYTFKQAQLDKQRNVIAAKLAVQEKKNLVTQNKINVAKADEAKKAADILVKEKDNYLIHLKKLATSEDAAIALKAQAEIAQAELELKQAKDDAEQKDLDLQVAKHNLAQSEFDLETAQLSVQKAQVEQAGFMSNLLTTLTGPLSLALSLWSAISTVMTVINAKKKIGIALSKEEDRAEKAKTKTLMANTGLKMAGSASQTPVVGWIIAAAILATMVGIAIATAAAANKQQNDGLEDTSDALNQIQADLYNLNTGITNVRKLGDEFETLSTKIIKSADDLERLNEIAKQVNDEAGRTVVDTNASTEEQLNQIRGYQIGQENKYQEKLKEANTTFGSGFDKYARGKAGEKAWSDWGQNVLEGAVIGGAAGMLSGNPIVTGIGAATGALTGLFSNFVEADQLGDEYVQSLEWKKKYIEELGTAGTMTIRSIAQNEIDNLASYSEEAQSILKDTFVSMAADMLTTNGLNTDLFNETFGKNFATGLEQALESGSLTSYYDFVENLSDVQKKVFLETNSIFQGIYELGEDGAKSLDKLGMSMDDINAAWQAADKFAKASGKATKDVFKTMTQSATAYWDNGENGLSSNQAMYKALVDEQQKLQEKVQSDIERYNQAMVAGDAATKEELLKNNEYYLAKKAEQDAQAAVDEAQKKLDKEKKDHGENSSQYKEQQEKLDEANAALAKTQQKVKDLEDAANDSEEVISEMQGLLLVDKPITDYTDSLTKLGSILERISKVGDKANLTIAEQMELLADYPELLTGLETGNLNAATALEVLQKQFKEQRDTLALDISSTAVKYGSGADSDTILKGFGKNIFEEDSADFLRKLYDGGQIEFQKQYQEQLGNKWESVWSDLTTVVQKRYLAKSMDENGIAISLNVTLDDAQTSQYKKTKAELEAITDELDRLTEGTDEYNAKLQEQHDKYVQLVKDVNAYVHDKDQQTEALNKIFGTSEELTQEDVDAIIASFDIVNGELIENAEAMQKLNETQLTAYKLVKEQIQDYAKTQKEYSDEAIEAAQNAAQIEIDLETAKRQAQVEELEKRKEALQAYFDEIDAVQEEEDRATQHSSLVNQIAALTGALDGTSKSKIKELQQELNSLKEEELQAQKERQREALLASIDNEIDTLSSSIDTLSEKLYDYTKAILEGKPLPQYASGGLVDYTGPAWVDGTPSNPEAFLSATDVRLIQDLVSSLRLTPVESNTSPVNIENIAIHTDHLDNNQDFANAGNVLAEAFNNAIRTRGINTNARK